MYAAATLSFMQTIGAEFLTPVPRFFFWAAIAAWSLTFFGMMRRLAGVVPILIGGRRVGGEWNRSSSEDSMGAGANLPQSTRNDDAGTNI